MSSIKPSEIIMNNEMLEYYNSLPSVMSSFLPKGQVYNDDHFDYDNAVTLLTKQLNGTLQLISDYPAWEYAKNSQLEKMCIDAYKNLTGNEPIIMALHAGLECGLLLEKMPHAEAISFGPNMYDVHTPNEHLSISSTENTWKFLLAVLKSMK